MTTGISEEDMKRIFSHFDANGDGKISSEELGDALRSLGSASSDEIKSTMAELDTDGDGYIDFDEFVSFCKANPGLMKDVAKVF
ncbi:polcalcin Phl p 7-like [Asparagus officinalis]|uniref:polcalcin Phl p 7-like n=1 Tax=Asparagus officinalis TaxID=4686 RepID=UPI00098E3911|nr:polcalcin Phl p 7-like [Asparagus officinalis]